MFRCLLCGSKATRKTFRAEATNYAEAFRLVTAHAWSHDHGEMHRAALAAYHGERPKASTADLLMADIFGEPLPSEHQMRRREARHAAVQAGRLARSTAVRAATEADS